MVDISLGDAADAFHVHPRTILRAISKEHNTYWYEDSNDDMLLVEDIAKAYGTTSQLLGPVFDGRDDLLLPSEAAQTLGIAARTFRKHLQKGAGRGWGRVGYGGITRYLRSRIIAAAIDRSE